MSNPHVKGVLKHHSGHLQLATLNGNLQMILNVVKEIIQQFCLLQPVLTKSSLVMMDFASILTKGSYIFPYVNL